jgi:hypothetical protein
LLLVYGDTIVAKVRARNSIGWGAYSNPNTEGQTTQQKPSIPSLAPVLISQAETALTVSMPEMTGSETGGSDILSYHLQYKRDGTLSFETIVGEDPDNLMLVISRGSLETDVVYLFQYRVKTKYGWSEEFSPVLSARTATTPSVVPSLSFEIID